MIWKLIQGKNIKFVKASNIISTHTSPYQTNALASKQTINQAQTHKKCCFKAGMHSQKLFYSIGCCCYCDVWYVWCFLFIFDNFWIQTWNFDENASRKVYCTKSRCNRYMYFKIVLVKTGEYEISCSYANKKYLAIYEIVRMLIYIRYNYILNRWFLLNH